MAGEGVEKEESVEAEPGNSGDTGNRFPVAEFFFEEGHWSKSSRGHSEAEGMRDPEKAAGKYYRNNKR